jgi:hypothetical protein
VCAVRRVITYLPEAESYTELEHAGIKVHMREDAVRQVAFDPADMVKARLLEVQYSGKSF